MDFYNDRYYINHNSTCDGTTGTFYTAGSGNTGVQNFITGTGATFTRAGTTNVNDTNPPFYLNTSTQAFVSRASVTNNVTSTFAPFFIGTTGNGPSQSFVSRASSGTYFDSTGTLQTKTSGSGATAQRAPAYYLSSGSWVLGGTLIEPASTNYIANSTWQGAATGTPGTVATGWSVTNSGLTTQVVATGTEYGMPYIDFRIYGTSGSTQVFPGLQPSALTTALPFQTWTNSIYARISPSSAGSAPGAFQVYVFDDNSSSTFINGGSNTTPLTSTLAKLSETYENVSGTAYVLPTYRIAWPANTTGDVTIRLYAPQLEQSSFSTSVIQTTNATVTRAADIYNQQPASYFDGTGTLYFAAANTARDNHNPTSPYADLGTLIEPAATNSIRNNMMIGAVAADGVERTNNGTFSNTSPNVCIGSVTSGGNTLSCNNGTGTGWVGTVNGGTGSVTAATGSMTLTGDGTNAASIYEAIPTVSGYVYAITVTTGVGSFVTIQAGTSAGDSSLLTPTSASSSSTTSYQFKASGANSYIQINNSSTSAATVTMVSGQSSGEFPTNWTVNIGPYGLVTTVAGTGTESNVNYVDLKVVGTSNSLINYFVVFDGNTAIAAAAGQTWTGTVYEKLTSGSFGSYSQPPAITISERQSGVLLPSQTSNYVTPTGSGLATQRYAVMRTLSNSLTNDIAFQFGLQYAAATTVNFTIRIGMPQLEQSSYSTSVIPTFGSAVTRTADVYSNPNGGTYLNSSGVLTQAAPNVPRLDHNPVSPYLPMGILIEENRTNLNTYSQDTTQTPQYATVQSTVANSATTSPDGTTDAGSLTDTAFTAAHYLTFIRPSDLAASTNYVASVFVKPNGITNIQLGVSSTLNSTGSNAAVNYNLSSGTIGTIIGTPNAYGIISLANGWYRCWFSFTSASSLSIGNTLLALSSGNSSSFPVNYTGTGTNGVYTYGFDVEAGAQPTSYIPTSGSTVTRAQDVFTIPGTAGGGSGWLTNNVGTLGAVGSVPYLSGNFQGFGGLDDGTASNSIYTGINQSQKRNAVTYASGNQYIGILSPNTSYTLGNSTKIAIAFSTSGGGFEGGAADNGAFSDGAYALPATQSRLTIGHARNTSGDLDGWVSRLWYLPITEPDYTPPNFTQ